MGTTVSLCIETSVKLKTGLFQAKKKIYDKKHQAKKNLFLRELSKTCYIKVIKRTKLDAPLLSEFDDEIIFTIVVYK